MSKQATLQAIKSRKEGELNGTYSAAPLIMTTDDSNPSFFVHTLGGKQFSVPRKIPLKSDISLNGDRKSNEFFRSIKCLDQEGNIMMDKLNQIKQYLDMIKDKTSPILLKELSIWNFGDLYKEIKYPVTLDLIKEYFFKHFEQEGRCNNIFWPRHGDFTGYVVNEELASHDCGFDPDLVHIKSPSDKIDPLAHGPMKPTDILFPKLNTPITWDSATLVSMGYPPGCEITAKCTRSALNTKSEWDVTVTCCDSKGQCVKVTSADIFKSRGGGGWDRINTQKLKIKNFDDMNKGNAFKSLMQKKGAKANPDNKLILLALTFIKSFGDNSFDMVQRALAILGVPTTIYTCDFTLFLSSITAMTESGTVLTTNHREAPDLPTGNFSRRFRATELQPIHELESIFSSCLFENNAYLKMLINLYNDARERDIKSVQIKLGGEIKHTNLWFLVTIIRSIKEMIDKHHEIFEVFKRLSIIQAPAPAQAQAPPLQVWRDNKQLILQLLKSYCKIVFPFVKKNGVWTVFSQSSLTSSSPTAPQGNDIMIGLIGDCSGLIHANKEMLNIKMLDVLSENGKHLNIGKINMQQYALLIIKNFAVADDEKLPDITRQISSDGGGGGASQGGGRYRTCDSIKTGGMEPPVSKKQKRTDPEEEDKAATLIQNTVRRQQAIRKLRSAADAADAADAAAESQALEASTSIFNADEFKAKIMKLIEELKQTQRSQQSEPDSYAENGFSPKALFEPAPAETAEAYLNTEMRCNSTILVVIRISALLSQILKLLSYMTTSMGYIGGSDEAEIIDLLQRQHNECIAAAELIKLMNVNIIEQIVGIIRGPMTLENMLSNPPNVPSLGVIGFLYDNIDQCRNLIIDQLQELDINPSSDTIEFAVSSLNLDIYNKIKENYPHKNGEYNMDPSLFYENIKNIAYNVFLNHEYLLPLDCNHPFLNMCIRHLTSESEVEVGSISSSMGNTQPLAYSPESSQDLRSPYLESQGETQPRWPFSKSIERSTITPKQLNIPEGWQAEWLDMPAGGLAGGLAGGPGGSSTRSRRRKHRRNNRRTQHTNKHKRPSSSQNTNRGATTIKHRKSYRKHQNTVKRRKNRRHHYTNRTEK